MGWLLLAVAVVIGVAAGWYIWRYLAIRGTRLVDCPETREPAAVDVRAARAALGRSLDLSGCSRWPERQACGRECLAEIERAPSDCLVRSVLTRWYEGKRCAVCEKPMGEIDWLERKPGLMDDKGIARLWPDVEPEQLPRAMAVEQPVCFDCYVALTFRREHPELVIDNPWKGQ